MVHKARRASPERARENALVNVTNVLRSQIITLLIIIIAGLSTRTSISFASGVVRYERNHLRMSGPTFADTLAAIIVGRGFRLGMNVPGLSPGNNAKKGT